MGIDYCASYADVIAWDAIAELVPQAAAKFMRVIEKHRCDYDTDYVLSGLAQCFRFSEEQEDELRATLFCDTSGEEDAAVADLKSAYHELQAAFSRATLQPGTQSNLQLAIGYHDTKSQGCRGDEIDGVFWYVEGAYELSAAGQRFQDKFERKYFTAWG